MSSVPAPCHQLWSECPDRALAGRSWLVDPSSNATACYKTFNQRIAGWVGTTNAALQAKSLPIRVVHFASMWGIKYNQPGRYHWMLQIFLREEGFSLASIGTGRNNFNQAVTEKELQNLTAGLVRACEAMQAGGWWANDVRVKTNLQIYLCVVREAIAEWIARAFGSAGKKQK